MMLAREALLQRGILARRRWMFTQVVSKGDRPHPLRRPERNQVQMVRAERCRRLAEPVFDIGLVRPVAISETLRRCDRGTRLLEGLTAGHDVDDRLGRQTRHPGAPDVLNRTGEPRRELAVKHGRLFLESGGPCRVVRNDHDWSFGHQATLPGSLSDILTSVM